MEYLLLCLPLISHLLIDKTGKVKHTLNAWIVIIIAVGVGFFLPGYFWQGTLYALTIHLFLFDFLYNLMHGHKFFYHGEVDNPDRSKFDKLWEFVGPIYEVFVKIWVLLAGIGVYYYLDRIISYL